MDEKNGSGSFAGTAPEHEWGNKNNQKGTCYSGQRTLWTNVTMLRDEAYGYVNKCQLADSVSTSQLNLFLKS